MSITQNKEDVFKFIREAMDDAAKNYYNTNQPDQHASLEHFKSGFLFGILFQTKNSLKRYVEDAISGKSSIATVVNQKNLSIDYHLFAHEMQDGITSCAFIDKINSTLDEKINQRILSLFDQVISTLDKADSKSRCNGKDAKIDPERVN